MDSDSRRIQNSKESGVRTIEKSLSSRNMLEGEQLFSKPKGKPLALYKKHKGTLWKTNLAKDGNQVIEKNLEVKGNTVLNPKVGIGTNEPAQMLHIEHPSLDSIVRIGAPSSKTSAIQIYSNADGYTWQMGVPFNADRFVIDEASISSGDDLVVYTGGNVGVGTQVPQQKLDVNAGSGAMIADGYNTHSLAIYKENIENASGYLDKVVSCPAQKWNSKPFISANKIKEAALGEFGEDVWNGYFPEENSHKNKALYNMPEGDLKTWIDNWCEAERVKVRGEAKWQKKRLGLVADAELTAKHLPEVIAINDAGEPTGIDTMTYIGILHNAIQELSAKVTALENK
jgi:hypothetical protein